MSAEGRKGRSDAGQVRMKPRDYAALTWLLDMRAITEPDLGWLLARLDGKDIPISEGGARAVVRRWQAMGLAEAHRILVGEPRLITATTRASVMVGTARVGADGRPQPVTVPAWTQMRHVLACSRVRLALEEELGADLVEWTSDREMRAREAARSMGSKSGLGRSHQPDALLLLASGERVAVEVELTAKSPKPLDEIVDGLSRSIGWDRVRYFAEPEAGRAVAASLTRLRAGRSPGKHPITVEPVPNGVLGRMGSTGINASEVRPVTTSVDALTPSHSVSDVRR